MRKAIRFLAVFAMMIVTVSQFVVVQSSLASSASSAMANANSIIPPRTGSNLRELVEALMNATEPEDRIDTDLDGLYDSVEIVIGTGYNNTLRF